MQRSWNVSRELGPRGLGMFATKLQQGGYPLVWSGALSSVARLNCGSTALRWKHCSHQKLRKVPLFTLRCKCHLIKKQLHSQCLSRDSVIMWLCFSYSVSMELTVNFWYGKDFIIIIIIIIIICNSVPVAFSFQLLSISWNSKGLTSFRCLHRGCFLQFILPKSRLKCLRNRFMLALGYQTGRLTYKLLSIPLCQL